MKKVFAIVTILTGLPKIKIVLNVSVYSMYALPQNSRQVNFSFCNNALPGPKVLGNGTFLRIFRIRKNINIENRKASLNIFPKTKDIHRHKNLKELKIFLYLFVFKYDYRFQDGDEQIL